DARLGRDVAIKVLPEEFSQHPHKLARFEREARLLAALNHPGIATLHGLEEIEGKPFLVMELVEGETLAERIARGPLPVDEALTISQQIAEALEAAHEKGVIHRDLKPANIKVDPEGHVKVLDFGLAKLAEPESESPGEAGSQSPTLSRDATRAGVILGTAAYMSPEQAKGKTVDKRTDIFSFGIVLYEMLTGKGAFAGEDVSDVLAAVIRAEPDWSALPKDLAPRLEALLQRCLRKDRKLRRRDIGDVGLEIQEILANSGSGKTAAPGVALERTSLWRAVVLTAMASALITGVTVWSVRPPGPLPPSRFAVTLPASDRLVPSGLALSPDGRDLVYVGIRDGVTSLYRRSMDQLEVEPIRGTEGAEYPFFSPDGEWVGFFADDKLNKVSLAGGPSVALCDARNFRGASWGQDNFIVFAARVFPGLMRVSASGGVPEEVTIPQEASPCRTIRSKKY
ncbi:MAG TPA: protein kinase, partial [Vicinamibacteria bacterium]